jgi:hypothetical protein
MRRRYPSNASTRVKPRLMLPLLLVLTMRQRRQDPITPSIALPQPLLATAFDYAMSSAGRRSLDSVRRLLQAAQGTYTPSAPQQAVVAETFSPQPVRCFPLRAHHVGNLSSSTTEAPSPGDFHSYLCNMIRNAKRRVTLASLYVGIGTAAQEEEFLNALADISPAVQVKLLLDENRATRPVSQPNSRKKTSSAEAVHQCLKHRENSVCGLYLFQALHEPRRSLLPSPLNEIAGVFHIKVNTSTRLYCDLYIVYLSVSTELDFS